MKYFVLFLFIVFLSSCTLKHKIEVGDEILIRLEIVNKLNKIIDESGYSNKNMPLLVKVGNSEVFSLIDNSFIGMELNEVKKIILPPNNAYGNKGVFYIDSTGIKTYIVEPNDTLVATIKVLKVFN